MFLPIRTDSPIRRTPYVNYALIAANILIYIVLDLIGSRSAWGQQTKRPLMLQPTHLQVFQFFTYQFLHGDRMHLLGNMFFLWIFGNSVNGKMGHLTYLLFYLACGVFAGIGFAIGDSINPCLGASGAIAGVTTAYLALFPRSEITVLYIWFFIGTMQVPSLLWILGKMIVWDNYIAMEVSRNSQYTNVAFEAHLAGYLFGFVLAFLMLAIRALPRDQFDVFALARRWYQRQTFAAAMRDPQTRARAQYGRPARVVDATAREAAPPDAAADAIGLLRSEIAAAISSNDFTTASAKYEQLIAASPGEALSRTQQLSVANQLYSLGKHAAAAEAYEKFLKTYPSAAERTHVRLILGIVCARYLARFDTATALLTQALEALTDPSQREQAQQWLDFARSAHADPPSAAGTQPAM